MPGAQVNGHSADRNGAVNGWDVALPSKSTTEPSPVKVMPARLQKLSDQSLFICDAFIDGKWVNKDTSFDVVDPATGKTFSKVASVDRSDFQSAIKSASVAQKRFYESTTAAQRGSLLRKWFDAIMYHSKDLATILCLENGKTFAEAEGEVVYAASFISWFAEEATRAYGDTIPSSTSNTTIMTVLQPIGVCGIITPWNFPAAMITRKVGPALAAGCACVIKPPSETPHTCLALTKLAISVGIPGECLQICPTKDRQAAMELVENPLVKKVSFTGSTAVGKLICRTGAGSMKKMSLELGGNAPFIVFDDADLELAVDGVMLSKFRCSGQTCVCANRILVQEGVVEDFTRRLVAKVRALKMGSGFDEGVTQGPLVNRAATDKVAVHVKDAVERGAKVHIGGSAAATDGFFFEPTVITGVTAEMQVAQDETFGPLAPIFSFGTEDEAVALSNDTQFGLAGYFFTRDIGRAMRVANKMECGMVGVNTGKISAAETPFGGILESGFGKEGSKYGLAEYMVMKAITIGNTHK